MTSQVIQGDCLTVMRDFAPGSFDAVITDPPYPNNAGHFDSQVPGAIDYLKQLDAPVVAVFWSELEWPPVKLPRVAVHIWHRTNVNGRPYEPVYIFAKDGQKRRSEVKQHAAVFDGVGPGCWEYAGHPTQKPKALMQWLILRLTQPGQRVLDPFCGSGTTGVACAELGRDFVGIEIDAGYAEIARKRIDAAMRQTRLFMPEAVPA